MLFQFHIGSIQSRVQAQRFMVSRSFQFHIGSIQSACTACASTVHSVFQFHIGSIQSDSLRHGIEHACSGFNSTLVRFKAADA